jgi:2-polyprenyl-6-methoxyphenol hydroxylase-like FAD-dependent oxidoreductase
MSPMRVAVAGGGLGGLCLAQGLRRRGIDVTVYERDVSAAGRRQGYRLHLDARAGIALESCLPPDLFALFQQTCGTPSTRFTVLSSSLRELRSSALPGSALPGSAEVDPYAAATLSTSVNRQTLREILATGLDVGYGREVTGYSAEPGGVRVLFGAGSPVAAGSPVRADVLVGADGVGSAVRRQYLPAAAAVDTGRWIVYGKTPLSPRVLELMPPQLLDGFVAVTGGRIGMATGLVRLRSRPEEACALIAPRAALTPVADYLMWAVAGDLDPAGRDLAGRNAAGRDLGGRDLGGRDLGGRDPAGLHALVGKVIASWHPDLRELHALALVEETFAVKVRVSTPVAAWPPSRVTVLGDAIHAMSPARGSGANTALRDAGELASALGSVVSGDAKLLDAIGVYETAMRSYGYAAVAASARAETSMGRGPLSRLSSLISRVRGT